MAGFSNRRVHPESCRCKMCRNKKKMAKHEYRFFTSSFWCVIFIMLALF